MTSADLAPLVTAFFVRHLAAERNVSRHTITAYRDSLKLFLRFARDLCHRPVAALRFDDLTPELILPFLTHLETDRHNTVRTRNTRLAAIHSFFRYVLERDAARAIVSSGCWRFPLGKPRVRCSAT